MTLVAVRGEIRCDQRLKRGVPEGTLHPRWSAPLGPTSASPISRDGWTRGFERVDGDIRELRAEIREMRTELRTEIAGARDVTKGEITGLRGEIDALRVTLIRVGGGMMAGLVGVIGAVLLGG